LAAPASAGDFVLEIGEEVHLEGIGGGWSRAFPVGDGSWHYLFGGGGDFRHMPLSANMDFDASSAIFLTGRSDLIDHAITRCPDGTYLHVASGQVNAPDDSAWAFRYDEDWQLMVEAGVDVANPGLHHNDPPVLCSSALDATVFQPPDDAEAEFIVLDGDLNPIESELTTSAMPPVPGSSLYFEEEFDTIIRVTAPELVTSNSDPRNKLIVFEIDWEQEGSYEVRTDVDLSDAGIFEDWHAYWPQGLVRIGEFTFVSHMARPVEGGFNQDEGNVFLQVLDGDFNLIESHQLTFDEGPEANQRPSLALQEEFLLVTYDKRIANQLNNFVLSVRLDLEAIEEGTSETDTGEDTDTGSVGEESESCACSGADGPKGGGGLWGLLLGLVICRRRDPALGAKGLSHCARQASVPPIREVHIV
jgi:hypothetical protein